MNQHSEKPVVLISGAAGGLGQAVVPAFASQGVRLAVTDRNQDGLLALRRHMDWDPQLHLAQAADITRLEDVQSLCDQVVAAYGRLDVVVHLAGGFRAGLLHKTAETDWNFLFDLNVRSVHHLAVAAVPIMMRQKQGVILHVASRAALHGEPGIGAYGAAKAAVVNLTQSMAAELIEHGIRVNCVLPSILNTPANRQAMPEVDFRNWVEPQSLAKVLLFLASPAARDISGAAIPVYGRS